MIKKQRATLIVIIWSAITYSNSAHYFRLKSSRSENKKSQSWSNLKKIDTIDIFHSWAIQNDLL